MAQIIKSFNVVDHGVENAQYFQGCGVSFTQYTHCVTGAGANYSEAFDDAFEQVAQCGFVFAEGSEADAEYQKELENAQKSTEGVPCDMAEEMYYYVSVQFIAEGEEG